jgi:hypothetical protein
MSVTRPAFPATSRNLADSSEWSFGGSGLWGFLSMSFVKLFALWSHYDSSHRSVELPRTLPIWSGESCYFFLAIARTCFTRA